jgi:hypothetical protein
VASEVEAENRQLVEEMHEVSGSLRYWTRELQRVFNEPHIKVVLAQPRTTVQGLKPNYYHIVRIRPGTAAWVQPIEDENGNRLELGSHVIDIALKADLWNDRTQKQLRKDHERAEKARVAQKIREGQARAAEFDERLASSKRTSILVTKDI